MGGIATPDHMQIGPYQDEVVAVNFARGSVGKLEHRHWRAARAYRSREPTWIGFGAAQFEHRVAVWNAVLDRRAVVEPDMRQPRAGPSRRLIFPKQVFGAARNVTNDRGIDITIAKLRANHFVAFSLLDIRDRAEVMPRFGSGG